MKSRRLTGLGYPAALISRCWYALTGTHPQGFPNIGDPDQTLEWYRDNYRQATSRSIDRSVGVQLELSTVASLPAYMSSDLAFQRSLVRAVCRR